MESPLVLTSMLTILTNSFNESMIFLKMEHSSNLASNIIVYKKREIVDLIKIYIQKNRQILQSSKKQSSCSFINFSSMIIFVEDYFNSQARLNEWNYVIIKLQKMLGKAYNFSRECCGTRVQKYQVSDIKILSPGQSPESQMQIYKDGDNNFSFGKLFATRYVNYCLCISCSVTFGYDIQFHNQRLTSSKMPSCCPCLGPFPIENKNEMVIGELQPHCYCWKFFGNFYSLCLPCCMSLDVLDQGMVPQYTIKRVPCTCFCCERWQVFDMAMNIKSQIIQKGCCCPDYDFVLPDDREDTKKLVLSALPYLP